jgi:hypothetical protein
MIVIRRMVDRRRAYTAIFLKGEPPKIFPTSDAEHARILQVYKQDRPHEGILNDFAETDFPRPASSAPPPPHAAPAPWPLTASPAQPSKQTKKSVSAPTAKKSVASARSKDSPPRSKARTSPTPLWLALVDPPTPPSRR